MKCNQCDGSGLIPFRRKDGSVVSNAFIYCDCRKDEPEHYHQPDTSDFDFPCSSAFRGYSYIQCGLPDPGYRPPEPELPKEQVIIHRHSNMGKEEYDLLQQTSLKADWLEKKLLRHLQPKEKSQPAKSGKLGIKIE